MTLPSVPIVLDKEYRFRLAQPDLLSIEEKLGPIFNLFKPGAMGVTAFRVILWRGLHQETDNGALVHVFPLNPKGLERAGDFLIAYTQNDGSYEELLNKLAPGLAAALGIPLDDDKKKDDKTEPEEGDTPKNQ